MSTTCKYVQSSSASASLFPWPYKCLLITLLLSGNPVPIVQLEKELAHVRRPFTIIFLVLTLMNRPAVFLKVVRVGLYLQCRTPFVAALMYIRLYCGRTTRVMASWWLIRDAKLLFVISGHAVSIIMERGIASRIDPHLTTTLSLLRGKSHWHQRRTSHSDTLPSHCAMADSL
jgi:hypothetical protein